MSSCLKISFLCVYQLSTWINSSWAWICMYVCIHFSSASALWNKRSFLLGYLYFIFTYANTVFSSSFDLGGNAIFEFSISSFEHGIFNTRLSSGSARRRKPGSARALEEAQRSRVLANDCNNYAYLSLSLSLLAVLFSTRAYSVGSDPCFKKGPGSSSEKYDRGEIKRKGAIIVTQQDDSFRNHNNNSSTLTTNHTYHIHHDHNTRIRLWLRTAQTRPTAETRGDRRRHNITPTPITKRPWTRLNHSRTSPR